MTTLLTNVGLEFAQGFLTALGLGLLMGLERERRTTSRAGLRTFGLTALLGAVCALLASHFDAPWLIGAGLLAVAAMMIASYSVRPDPNDPGTTSVVALLLAFGFGAMAWYDEFRSQAVMLAIVSTVLLYFKAQLKRLTSKLTERDIISILQFAVLSLVILPILPDQGFGPYQAINPYQVWWMVVLISGVSLAGYGALRVAGQRHGAPLLGVLGGLVSSTATTLVYARHSRETPTLNRLALVVILTANLVVLVRLSTLTAVVQPGLLRDLLPQMLGGALAGLVVAVLMWRHMGRQDDLPELELRNPTEIRTALTFGAIYAVVLFLSAWLADIAGSRGLYLVALASGLTDVDAITLSSLRLYSLDRVTAHQAVTAVGLAVLANLGFKLAVVTVVAGRQLAQRVALGFSAVAIGGLGGWWLGTASWIAG
ncbi:hypothetical protein OTERR_14180 [Oryzomicrobium terrae]|uniref:Uncharacterized protein n=1 Tax=Oryzomicrobium terrae TaxID=1735038 RepID=A0A5C1E8D7_9RHOO|nr:MgtC/SapB family protein [Oryzomicrobium terrae]QEL64894.1 hypothetical protein OTERR_14180 [Oryzomicrobium terrae]